MQLSAVILARFIALVETFDLDPRGKVFFPQIVEALVERCQFQKFPKEYGELDQQKGIDFLGGRWSGVNVDRLTIYLNGILIDTSASTSDSERILEEVLLWATSEFGVAYRPGMIKRKIYVSNLTFTSDVPLLGGLSPALSKLSSRIAKTVKATVGQAAVYEPHGISIQQDHPPMGVPVSPFTIHRRLETPFSENKYFSEAPLPTDVHISLLEQFEADLSDCL